MYFHKQSFQLDVNWLRLEFLIGYVGYFFSLVITFLTLDHFGISGKNTIGFFNIQFIYFLGSTRIIQLVASIIQKIKNNSKNLWLYNILDSQKLVLQCCQSLPVESKVVLSIQIRTLQGEVTTLMYSESMTIININYFYPSV